MSEIKRKIKVGISIGDINGIGLEVILKTLIHKDYLEFFTPVIFGSFNIVRYHKKVLKLNVHLHEINDLKSIVDGKINVYSAIKDDFKVDFGESTQEAGKASLQSLEFAVLAVSEGLVDTLVTAPINKNNIHSESFPFYGHTEYLKSKWGGESLMFMINEDIKVGLVTHHIPLKEVASSLTKDLIINKAKAINESLKIDFGIERPKIAVLSLNPHAGDKGLMGDEEQTTILPAIGHLTEKENILAYGPYPADSFFTPDNISKFDAVLGMYHDQGLVPFKTLTFGEGVNFTAGLPFVRTSPDHGVAYEIAGKDKANSNSFSEAIFGAVNIFKRRSENIELKENALKKRPTPAFKRSK